MFQQKQMVSDVLEPSESPFVRTEFWTEFFLLSKWKFSNFNLLLNSQMFKTEF